MRNIQRFATSAIATCLAAWCFGSTPLLAQEGQSAVEKAESEMENALGGVPVMMEVYPEHLRAAAWEWFKATQNPEASVPSKYTQLISLAVAAQIPCAYCVYAHTQMAKAAGATDEEIREAVAAAAEVRHWSTVLNGNAVDFDGFKAEWDDMMAHMKEQAEMEGSTQ
jgi:AhpD family alkylhydroperoxidase